MQIVGHGIPDDVVAGLGDGDRLVLRPADGGQASVRVAPRPSINRGYTPPRSERLSYSLGVVVARRPVRGVQRRRRRLRLSRRSTSTARSTPRTSGPTAGGPTFRDRVSDVVRARRRGVARRMTEIFAAALGLPVDHFAPFTDHSIDVLRMNHYDVPDRASSSGRARWGWAPTPTTASSRCCGPTRCPGSRSCGPTARGRPCCRRPARC